MPDLQNHENAVDTLMAYVRPNHRTKTSLREALAAGKTVEVYEPGLGTVPSDGTVFLEGPHYPAPHTWYATGKMQGGRLVSIK